MFRRTRKMFITAAKDKAEADHYVEVYTKFLKMKRDKYALKHFKPFAVKKPGCDYYLVFYFM